VLIAEENRVTFFITKKVTIVRLASPHPSATAHQPKASDPKNSLNDSGNCWSFWFAVSLVPISLTPLSGPAGFSPSLDEDVVEGGSQKEAIRAAQTVSGHGLVPIRDVLHTYSPYGTLLT